MPKSTTIPRCIIEFVPAFAATLMLLGAAAPCAAQMLNVIPPVPLRIEDACAANPSQVNGQAEPGETVRLVYRVCNLGGFDLTGFSAMATCNAGDLTCWSDVAFTTNVDAGCPDLPVDVDCAFGTPTSYCDVAFDADINAAAICGTSYAVDLDFQFNEPPFAESHPSEGAFGLPDPCSVCGGPDVVMDSQAVMFDMCPDAIGDADLAVDPGEIIDLDIILRNDGNLTAYGVRATLSSTTPGVTVGTATAFYGDIDPAMIQFPLPSYQFTVDTTVACGATLDFALDVTWDTTGARRLTFTVPVDSANCNVCRPRIATGFAYNNTDVCSHGGAGDGDFVIDPGETITFTVELENVGTLNASGVTAVVTPLTTGVAMTQAGAAYPDLFIGSGPLASLTDFAFTTDPALVDCGATLDFQIDVSYQGGGPDTGTFALSVPTPCTPCVASSSLVYRSHAVTGTVCSNGGPGNGDSVVDPGEAVTSTVTLENNGTGPATGVSAVLTSLTTGVNVTAATAAFADIPAGATGTSATPFVFTSDVSLSDCGDTLQFQLDIQSNDPPVTEAFDIVIPTPCNPCTPAADLAYVSWAIDSDTCSLGGPASGDGNLDPGEAVTMTVTLRNAGALDAMGVSATLRALTTGVTVTSSLSSFPDFAPGASHAGDTPFAFTTNTSRIACGDPLDFALDIDHAAGTETETFSLTVPADCVACKKIRASVVLAVPADLCLFGGSGSTNGSLDPGEGAALVLTLLNTTFSACTGVSGTLSTTAAGVTILKADAAFGDMGPLTPVLNTTDPFALLTDATAIHCGDRLDFDLALQAREGFDSTSFGIDVPNSCIPCVLSFCLTGTPDRIADLRMTKTGADIEMTWTLDTKAQGGYDIYMTNLASEVSNLRNPTPANMHAGILDPQPWVYANGVTAGLTYYEVLGVCIDGTSQGPS